MSPAMLRRYRAERLLRREFEGLRERVLGIVRGRLRARGITLDPADLEECYAMAWQGLYAALLEGEELENPTGWLALVCFRRAIDEHRARLREQQRVDCDPDELAAHHELDLAGALDDRMRLRHTFEGLRERLNAREQQAASLCYLQGFSRAQAAAYMGVSEARMRKLMEGRGPGRPGVAAKVEELAQTIRAGGWCEQQASLMRGLAYGILDPDGERYRLAQLHRRECPACRAYVISLRGLAAVLPPLALPWGPGAAGLGGAAAAAGGGAGGSVFAGGSLATKLATGCLLAAGVGGGCVALIAGSPHTAPPAHRHDLAAGTGFPSGELPPGRATSVGSAPALATSPAQRGSSTRSARSATHPAQSAGVVVAGQAQRELGFERTPAPAPAPTPSSQPASAGASSPRGAGREFGAG